MKVLVISHNPVSSQSNMGKTFLSLFSGFERESLCQLYIYPTIPDEDYCGSYYRVTDKEALRSLFFRGKIGGEVPKSSIGSGQGLFEEPRDEAIYRNPGNKSPLRRFLRDGMWRIAPWYNGEMKAWLERERPDCIFVAPGAAEFLYDFALRIGKDRKLPIVTYLCDEFYFVRKPSGLLERLRLKGLRRKMEKLLAASSHLVVISRELEEAYSRFGVPTSVLMTGSSGLAEQERTRTQLKTISYFGNIRCNRYVSLCEIGAVLDTINREQGTDYRLKIYTAEKNREILHNLEQYDSLELAGYVTGAAFTEAMGTAELLLHVEAFDSDSIDRVKHSVSTKIADSLASGIPLLAYGPGEVSSMKHLARWDCAMIAAGPEQLRNMLLQAFRDPSTGKRVAENGLKVAKTYHDSSANSSALRRILERVYTSYENTPDQ